ncbi:hypothetical protein AB1N83_013176 [Pleurotus pulmonarius]
MGCSRALRTLLPRSWDAAPRRRQNEGGSGSWEMLSRSSLSSILKPRAMSTQSSEEKKKKKDEDEDVPSPYMIIASQRIDTHPVDFPFFIDICVAIHADL